MRRHHKQFDTGGGGGNDPILVMSIPFDSNGAIVDSVSGNSVLTSNYNILSYDSSQGSYYIQGRSQYGSNTGWNTYSMRIQTSLPDPSLYDYQIEFDGKMTQSNSGNYRCTSMGFLTNSNGIAMPFAFQIPTANTASNIKYLETNTWKHIKLFVSFTDSLRKGWVDGELQLDSSYTFSAINTNYFLFLTTRWNGDTNSSSRMYIKNFTLHAIPRS